MIKHFKLVIFGDTLLFEIRVHMGRGLVLDSLIFVFFLYILRAFAVGTLLIILLYTILSKLLCVTDLLTQLKYYVYATA